MKTSLNGVSFIKQYEGYSPRMYRDVAGLPTIGYGTLIDEASEQWLLTANISEAEATNLLAGDLYRFENAVNTLVTAPLNQNQFDALVSLNYNIGVNNFKTSSLLKSINNNASKEEIETNWKKWHLVKGVISKGLDNRRKAELELYFSKKKN